MTDHSLTWRRLHFALPLELPAVISLLRQLATMHSAPRLVLESDGQAGSVEWWLGAPLAVIAVVDELLPIHLPGSMLYKADERRGVVVRAARLTVSGHRWRQLGVDRTEATARALLSSLASARTNELLRIQIILGDRLHPTSAPFAPKPSTGDAERRRLLAAKISEHGFGCSVRIGVRAATVARQRHLIGSTLAAVRTLESPGLRTRLWRTWRNSMNRASSPLIWPLELSVSELVGLLGWPIGELPLPGVGAAHPKPVAAPSSVVSSGRVIGSNDVMGVSRPVALSVLDSLRHLHIIGPTGTGKSTLIGNLALQDMQAGRSVVVIDPKGDLVNDLLRRIPDHRVSDVVRIDATDQAPVGLNPLVGSAADTSTDGLVSVFRDLYADSWGPRTQDILHASVLTLARRGDASLVLVPLLLTNPGFRRSVVGRITRADPMGLGTFWAWFDSISEAERASAIAPLMNKLRPILLRPGLRAMLGQTQPRFDLSQVFSQRRIVLVNLAKGDLGPESARLLGSMVVSILWQRALERSRVPAHRRHPVMIFIDEVQDYLRLPGDLADALAQARGLGVGFTLAHQHLSQLTTGLRSGVLANTRSRICFQLSQEDAAVLARGSQLDPEDFTALPGFQAYASLLSGGTPTPFASLTTTALPEKCSDPTRIRRDSQTRYGRPLSEVEAAWAALAGQTTDDGVLGRVKRPDRPDGRGRS